MRSKTVISELQEYATSVPPPKDGAEALATAEYLSALNNIFERTLLGKTRIFYHDGSGMQRLEKGFSYFREWAEEHIQNGAFNTGVDSKEFIAWQVWLLECKMV